MKVKISVEVQTGDGFEERMGAYQEAYAFALQTLHMLGKRAVL